MLERYFVKPSTLDRVRGSWIAPAIEQYVASIVEPDVPHFSMTK